MKNRFIYKIIVIAISINCFSTVYAQSGDPGTDSPATNVVFSAEALSNAIYTGRNLGADQSGFNPSVIFNHKSGLSLSAYCYGLSAAPGFIAETDLQAAFKKKLSSILSITPGYSYIINQGDSSNVLNNVLNLSLDLDLSFLSINNYTGFSFGGGTTAWYNELTLSKEVSVFSKDKNSVSITPTFVDVIGTKGALATLGHGKNLYKKHVSKAVGIKKGKGNGGSGTSATIAEISNSFIPLSYEFQLPITYTHKNLAIALIPHYDIPVNITKPVETTLTGNPFYLAGKITYTLPLGR